MAVSNLPPMVVRSLLVIHLGGKAMDVTCKLTIFFENPFWVAVYESTTNKGLEVTRVVFGAEPKDYEIYAYFLENWNKLRFSIPVADSMNTERKLNPKRMQRSINNQLANTGIGTKAQQALKLQQEQNALQKKVFNREKSEEEKQLKFEIRQKNKKEKHKGR